MPQEDEAEGGLVSGLRDDAAMAKTMLQNAFWGSFEMGRRMRTDTRAQSSGRLFQLVIGAVVLGLATIVLLLMQLISGNFADAIGTDHAFSNSANNTTDNAGTAFNIMSVALLVVPVVIVVGLLIGAFMTGNLGRRVRR